MIIIKSDGEEEENLYCNVRCRLLPIIILYLPRGDDEDTSIKMDTCIYAILSDHVVQSIPTLRGSLIGAIKLLLLNPTRQSNGGHPVLLLHERRSNNLSTRTNRGLV